MVCFTRFKHVFKWCDRSKWFAILPRVYKTCSLEFVVGWMVYKVNKCNEQSIAAAISVFETYITVNEADDQTEVTVTTDRIWDGTVTTNLLLPFNADAYSLDDATDVEKKVGEQLSREASFFSGAREIGVISDGPVENWSGDVRIGYVLRQIHEHTPVRGVYVNGLNFIVSVDKNRYSVINGEVIQHFPMLDLDDGFDDDKVVLAFPKVSAELKAWRECTDGSVSSPLIGDL
jgi:hypothetical protein